MKSPVLIVLLSTLIALSVNGQKIDPRKISIEKKMLHFKNFPQSSNIHWHQVNDLLQARFLHQGFDKIVLYDAEMNVVQEWTELKVVPLAIDLHLSFTYDSYKLKKVYEVIDKQKSTSFYSALTKIKGHESKILTYDKAHEIIDDIQVAAIIE